METLVQDTILQEILTSDIVNNENSFFSYILSVIRQNREFDRILSNLEINGQLDSVFNLRVKTTYGTTIVGFSNNKRHSLIQFSNYRYDRETYLYEYLYTCDHDYNGNTITSTSLTKVDNNSINVGYTIDSFASDISEIIEKLTYSMNDIELEVITPKLSNK